MRTGVHDIIPTVDTLWLVGLHFTALLKVLHLLTKQSILAYLKFLLNFMLLNRGANVLKLQVIINPVAASLICWY
jgi:hypothetical protein